MFCGKNIEETREDYRLLDKLTIMSSCEVSIAVDFAYLLFETMTISNRHQKIVFE